MLTNSPILLANKQLTLSNGIFSDPGNLFAETCLSQMLTVKIEALFSQIGSKSLFSYEIEQALKTDSCLSVLSSRPYAFIEALGLSAVNTVLNLTHDFGGATHYIADQVSSIDCVYTDIGIAQSSALRCANKPNSTHICAHLNELNFPSNSYDLIIIGQLEELALPKAELEQFLAKLRRALSSKGVLLVNAQNQHRLSKLVNKGDASAPYHNSYHSSALSNELSDVGRREFRNAVLAQNFSRVEFHASFSQSDDYANLFSEDYLTSNVDALNHFHQIGYLDDPSVCEYLYFKRLVDEKHNLVDYASRFLIIAGASHNSVASLYSNDFTYFDDLNRQPAKRVRTHREKSSSAVRKTLSMSAGNHSVSAASETPLLRHVCGTTVFRKGPLVVNVWLDALLNNETLRYEQGGLDNAINDYSNWLVQYMGSLNNHQVNYDLLPHNLILNERSGEYLAITEEWFGGTELSAEFMLFRALFWFAKANQALLLPYAKKYHLQCIGDFVLKHQPQFTSLNDLDAFAKLEQRYQSELFSDVAQDSITLSLLQPFSSLQLDKNSVNQNEQAPLRLRAGWDFAGASAQSKIEELRYADWQRSQSSQILTLDLPVFDASSSTPNAALVIAPLDTAGCYRINAIKLLSDNGQPIWIGDHQQADLTATQIQGDLLISSGIDSTLRFNLSEVINLEQASHLHISISWVWGQEHSSAMQLLLDAARTAHSEVTVQGRRINDYQARVDEKDIRIADLKQHRDDLIKMVKKIEKRIDIERNVQGNLYAQIEHLEGRLHAQHVRNDELHSFLLMRPSSRIKRFASRWVNRLKGTPVVEAVPQPALIIDESSDQEVPFNELPEGEMVAMNTEDYELWIQENTLSDAEIAQAKSNIEKMPYKPVFSILVPIYNTDPEYLLPMIRSVQNQIYPHWQLCLVDDCSPKTYLKRILEQEAIEDDRICIQLNDVNQGISVTTNDALSIATGDYIALLDHDDEITIDALYENAKLINQSPDVGLIYSDEDKMELDGTRIEPYFKPDYSPDLLDTNNYICHFTVIRKTVIDQIGGFREGLDGSQDHDVILRAVAAADKVAHIPKILYHWRKIPGSTAVEYDSKGYAWEAGRKAIEDLHRKYEDGVRVEFGSLKGSYRIVRQIVGEPLVSIIIPFKDKPALLDACLDSILNRSSYRNFEIIGVSNNSEEALTHERMAHFSDADPRVRFIEHNVPFNFSEICNVGVEQAQGKYIVLLNNDIEIVTPDWIENMLQHAQRENVGAVGCKLLFPDGRIQHAGVVAGMVGAAGHPHKLFPESHIGYHGRLHMVSNVSAVTGAMMMTAKHKFDEVGGLDADKLAVAYNDVDLCLKLLNKGYFNVFTPYAKAVHHESVSRGYEDTDEKMQRLLTEQAHFLETWKDLLAKGDPFYNPNMSLKNERFSLKFKD